MTEQKPKKELLSKKQIYLAYALMTLIIIGTSVQIILGGIAQVRELGSNLVIMPSGDFEKLFTPTEVHNAPLSLSPSKAK